MTRPRELRSSFGSAATAYARHRPDYAPTAIEWALQPTPGRRVLDLGAGTGKLTVSLVERGYDVVAVEPDPAMLAELRTSVPSARVVPGSAEIIPVRDGSVDAVLAGNAMHWFEMDAAAPEIARVLVPGGVVAGLWNLVDDQVDWVAQLARVGGPQAIGPRDTPAAWQVEAAQLHRAMNGTGDRVGPPEQAQFAHGQRRTLDSLVATFSTKAGILVMTDQERAERLDRIRAFLAGRPETSSGEFTVPMITGVLRTRRRGFARI
jgi:SAM-dependent methyltransferase